MILRMGLFYHQARFQRRLELVSCYLRCIVQEQTCQPPVKASVLLIVAFLSCPALVTVYTIEAQIPSANPPFWNRRNRVLTNDFLLSIGYLDV